jgi:hypothetical protein
MMPTMKVFIAEYTEHEADGTLRGKRTRVFSTMAKAITFLAELLSKELEECEWLDESQKLSVTEITEKCNECTKVNPDTGLVHMMYQPKPMHYLLLRVSEEVVW